MYYEQFVLFIPLNFNTYSKSYMHELLCLIVPKFATRCLLIQIKILQYRQPSFKRHSKYNVLTIFALKIMENAKSVMKLVYFDEKV